MINQSKTLCSIMTTKFLANLAIFITVTLWGVSFISIKIALNEVPPVTMALIRFSIASTILLFITKKFEPTAKLEHCDFKKMILAGFLGITVYFYFENNGVKLTTASSASLVTAIIPILAIAMDMVIFKTKVSFIQFFGIFIAIAGLYLAITTNGQINFSSQTFKGNLLVTCAMVSWSLYTLLNKSLKNKYSGLFLTTYQTIFGTLLLIPLSLFECSQWHAFSLVALCNILFLAICCSAVGYFFYIYALCRLDVTITTLYLNLMPVVGVVSGHFILNENIFPAQLIGGIMILFSIILINFSPSPKAQLACDKS